MSIKEMALKIKGVGEKREIFLSLLIILTTFGSFGLGRLSKIYDSRPEVKIRLGDGSEMTNEVSQASNLTAQKENLTAVGVAEVSGKVVASKSGSKYHFPWCGGASQISEANKIWFDSAQAAEKAGYSKAANCKGL